ncbi:hypothetical protein BST61_g6712 [Cercospora zeina]
MDGEEESRKRRVHLRPRVLASSGAPGLCDGDGLMRSGRRQNSFSVHWSSPPPTLVLVEPLEDSGIGMSRELQNKDLFRAFKQEDSLPPGTGLGLNLVANIVKSMAGTVHVQSEVGSENDIEYCYALQTPTIIICKNRASAIRLRSSRSPIGLPDKMSLLWPPISATKLSSAVATLSRSMRRDYFASACMSCNRRHAHASASRTSDAEHDTGDDPRRIVHERTDLRSLPDQGHVLTQRPQLTRSSSEPMASPTRAGVPTAVVMLPNPQASLDHMSPTSKPTPKSLSLLLVDDNVINLRILEAFAKKGGHLYQKAYNGQEAVDLYRCASGASADDVQKGISGGPRSSQAVSTPTSKPEIILMDINMPILDGFGATRAIRDFERRSGVAKAIVIAVTGLGDISAQDEAFACGMDLFLTKPVRMRDLNEVVGSLGF